MGGSAAAGRGHGEVTGISKGAPLQAHIVTSILPACSLYCSLPRVFLQQAQGEDVWSKGIEMGTGGEEIRGQR